MKTQTQLVFFAAALAFGGCSPKPTPEASTPPTAAAAHEPAAPAAVPEAASPRPGCAQNFAAFDANGDQRLSRQEFLERPHAQPDPEAIFHARDSDADGSLTSDEFCSGWRGPTARGVPGRGPAGGGPAMGSGACAGPGTGPCAGPGMGMAPGGPGMGRGPGSGPGMGGGRGGGSRCEAHFARFDTNGDANISEEEFTALPHPHGDAHAIFSARDQNHDGLLTTAEFCAVWSLPNPPDPSPAP
jgi:Ca2+-binding EF-hand superfamily protein